MKAAASTLSTHDVVVAGIRDMYDAFMSNDRERFDSHLHSETTTWESEFPRMYTRAELDALRDARDSEAESLPGALQVEPRRVEVWGETAVVAYLLRVLTPEGETALTSRVTDVLRLYDDGWRIVHHHAQDRDVDEDAPQL